MNLFIELHLVQGIVNVFEILMMAIISQTFLLYYNKFVNYILTLYLVFKEPYSVYNLRLLEKDVSIVLFSYTDS